MRNKIVKPSWKIVKFGDVVKNANLVERDFEGAGIERIVGLEHIDPQDLHIRRWNTPENGTSFTRKFMPGQTLFGKRRAYQRKVAFAEFDGICSGDILTFEPKSSKVLLPELLPFICQTDAFFDHALDTSAGSLSPRTSWKALKDFEFPLPPIEEQKRIAEIFWSADGVVETWINVLSSLENLYQVYWRTTLNRKSASKVKIMEIARVGNGTTPSRKNDSYWSGGSIPWLSSGKIHDRHIRYADEYITEKARIKMKSSHFPAGSVLVAMIGQGKTRGTAALLHIDAYINQNLAGIVPIKFKDGEYIFYCLDQMYEELRNWSHGSNQAALNCKLIGSFPIPWPDHETRHFITKLSIKIDEVMGDISSQIERTRSLMLKASQRLLSKS